MAVMHYKAKVRPDRLLELPAEALEYVEPGQEIDVDLDLKAPDEKSKPNVDFWQMLSDITEIKKGMSETDGSETDKMLREGRSGGMYG